MVLAPILCFSDACETDTLAEIFAPLAGGGTFETGWLVDLDGTIVVVLATAREGLHVADFDPVAVQGRPGTERLVPWLDITRVEVQ